ncbi:MAG: prepilin-type N-terminal cleavage/methylation domain-containing protein [Verrucomicrobiaceae bacterium]|nr:prepilin-type N-terminal cleavage/methylation domain-containing protein [Verrucomicrobiaceae bacterium]
MFAEPNPYRKNCGFSLVEVIVTVTVLVVITSIAIKYFGGTLDASRSVVAEDVMTVINNGLKKHSQINYEFNLSADHEGTDDEIAILRSLQWRDPVNLVPGAPFIPGNWQPVPSSDIKEYRLRWNGKVFNVIEPGASGSGIKVQFDASDYGLNYTFPDDFVPVGA